MLKSKIIIFAILLLSLILYSYTLLRAYNLSFTHDESLTYTIVEFNSGWINTANHHPLNTWLMKLSSLLFGNSELALRLPNLVAHLLFLLFSYLIFKKLKDFFILFSVFITLNFNPFILDFFSLARGYGLSLAFMLGSIYFILEFIKKKESDDNPNLHVAFFLATLSVLANYIMLNYYISIIVVVLVLKIQLYFQNGFSVIGFLKKFVKQNRIWLLYNIIVLSYIFTQLFKLQNSNELYFGGEQNILQSTLDSIIKTSLYGMQYGPNVKHIITCFTLMIFSCAVILLILHLFINKKMKNASVIFLVIIIVTILPIIQNTILNVPYPFQRTALMYIPCIVLTFAFCLNEFFESNKKMGRIIIYPILICISTLVIYNWTQSYNLTQSYSFSNDKNTKVMINDLTFDFMESHAYMPISIGVNWIFEPTANYYRLYKKLGWLDPVSPDGLYNKIYDYYYCYQWEKEQIEDNKNIIVLKYYNETQTILAKRKNNKFLILDTIVTFNSLPPSLPYSEGIVELDSINANDEIVLRATPKSIITGDMKAYLILYSGENWKETMVFHEQISGNDRIILSKNVLSCLRKPILIYRNWQEKLVIPSIDINVQIFRKR